MNQLTVQSKFPIGIAWLWVKASFAIFREKPINFMFFALLYVFMSALPFMGSFFVTVVLIRILLSSHYIEQNEYFGLGLNIASILRQKNLLSLAIFNVGFDLITMSILSEVLNSWGYTGVKDATALATMLGDSRVISLFVGMSVFRIVFFGIAPAIMVFNPESGVIKALILSWKFIIKNIVVLLFAVFLLLPFLFVPLYLVVLAAFSVTNLIVFLCLFIVMVILGLLSINIMAIFSYKLYKDGIKCA